LGFWTCNNQCNQWVFVYTYPLPVNPISTETNIRSSETHINKVYEIIKYQQWMDMTSDILWEISLLCHKLNYYYDIVYSLILYDQQLTYHVVVISSTTYVPRI
jgi:hypothetical protein